jgi:hypothetical protein
MLMQMIKECNTTQGIIILHVTLHQSMKLSQEMLNHKQPPLRALISNNFQARLARSTATPPAINGQ